MSWPSKEIISFRDMASFYGFDPLTTTTNMQTQDRSNLDLLIGGEHNRTDPPLAGNRIRTPSVSTGADPPVRVARNQSIIDTANRAFRMRSVPSSRSGGVPERSERCQVTINDMYPDDLIESAGPRTANRVDSDITQVQDLATLYRSQLAEITSRGQGLDAQARRMIEALDGAIAGVMGSSPNTHPTQTIPRNVPSKIDATDSDSDSDDTTQPSTGSRRVRFVGGQAAPPAYPMPSSGTGGTAPPPPTTLPANAGSLSAVDVLQLLSRFDNRPVPKPDRYTWQGGRNLEQFLLQFQQYCEATFRGDTSLWVGELSSLLSGEVKEVLDSVWAYGMSFKEVKDALLGWASTQEKHRDQDAKNAFSTARVRNNETLGRFCLRLESLFKLAYPRKVQYMEKSSTLRKKLLDSVDPTFKAELRTAQLVHESMAQLGQTGHTRSGDYELSWTAIKALAVRYDSNMQLDESNREVWRARYQDNRWPRARSPDVTHETLQPSYRQGRQPVASPEYEFWTTQPTDRSRPRQRGVSATGRDPRPVLTGSNIEPVGQRGQGASPGTDRQSGSASDRWPRSHSTPRTYGSRANCSYCGRPNHSYDNCRRRKRECLFCASPDHFVRHCDLAAARFSQNAPAAAPSAVPRRNRSRLQAPLEPIIVHAPPSSTRQHQGN